jgi:hypothetical protein
MKRSKLSVGKLVCLLGWLVLIMAGPVVAQTKIQVVTKTITRKLDYKKDTRLRITGEKAKINVRGWERNYIGVTIKLTAKHPEREIAEKELEHLQFTIKQSGNVHDLGNYFLVPKGTAQIQANLKAEYEISVPDYLPITISCKFGEVNLENTKGKHTIDMEYSQLNLNQVAGEMTMRLVLTDVKSRNTDLVLKSKAEKADMDLENADGSYQIENVYGQVKLTAGKALRNVNIQASRTSVTLLTRNFEAYNYDLATSYAELTLPAQAKPQIKRISGEKSTYRNVKGKNMPTIKIITTYSPVTIRNQVN